MDLLATASRKAESDDSTPGTLCCYPGGVGRNIAENLIRLGVDVNLVSAVGDDDFGRQVLQEMRALGLEVGEVSIDHNAVTASYIAVHDNDGELLHAISDMRIFDDYHLPAPDRFNKIIDTADAVVVDANVSADVLADVAVLCRDKMLIADGVSRSKCIKLAGVLGSISLLKVNHAEAVALTGCKTDNDETLIQALHRCGPQQVLFTAGEKGVVLSNHTGLHRLPAITGVEVVSTAGAGDAMLGAVIAASLTGCGAVEQLRWGTRAAAETLRVDAACSKHLTREMLEH